MKGGAAAGRGELNAALEGLTLLVGVLAPYVWGRLTLYFSSTATAAVAGKVVFQPGGQFVVAAALRSVLCV